jgi:SAM-dependent methyltransferase
MGGDPFGTVADRFVAHYAELRGRLRTRIVHRQLEPHLRGRSCRVVDVGGGAATQAIPLARAGHRVTVVDPSVAMLAAAREALAAEPVDVRERVSLVEGRGEDAPALVGAGVADVVCCHGVVMYLDDPGPLLAALAAVVRPGGVVSIIATNRRCLAARAALRGRWDEALGLFDADRYVNGLDVDARADDPDDLTAQLAALGVDPVAWYGVRVFSDAWAADDERFANADPAAVEAVEWEAGRRDPYRQLSRLLHWIGRRR